MRRILAEAGRADDYLEIGLDGSWQWNPLDDPLLDTYSLAYSVSSLINQLFGKSREPFWQQAYTNLVRWIIVSRRMRITARNRLSSIRTARSAVLAVRPYLIPAYRNGGETVSSGGNAVHVQVLSQPSVLSSSGGLFQSKFIR